MAITRIKVLDANSNINVASINVSSNIYANNFYYANGTPLGGGTGTGITYTAASSPPASGNTLGSQWYNTATDVLYSYEFDGTNYYWVDINTPYVSAAGNNVTTLTANNLAITTGNVGFGGNANVTIDMSTRTDAIIIPVGNTAQRPSNAANGYIRFNTTTGAPEWYSGATSSWLGFYQTPTYTINYLIVAGGGGGGGSTYYAGGGGAGGLVSGSQTVLAGTSYSITVGSGGAVGASSANGSPGSNSSISSTGTAVGGGYGANNGNVSSIPGGPGGSGGGASGFGGSTGAGAAGGSGTSGQGNTGGAGWMTSGSGAGGGGGGASASGGAGSNNQGGAGGTGATSSITGTSTSYAGGGGGGGGSGAGTGGAGGSGGGAPGAGTSSAGSTVSNSGGGGGGGSGTTQGGSGGASGIVIISYINNTQKGTGGTVTSFVSSNNTTWVHTFTSSGTFTA